MANFALIGVGGYIAPRHLGAIKHTGHKLIAAMDPNDSVGILDSYFPDASFFTEFERFDRHLDKLRRSKSSDRADFVSICSPNYLHDSHIRFALRLGADAICEKPLVLNPWNIDGLLEIERETGRKVFTILQLRLHPAVIGLRERMTRAHRAQKCEVDLAYITSRGNWYLQSWKGDSRKSGGIVTNIGVHFFDMLHFVFGEVLANTVHLLTDTKAAGFLEYEGARVRWFLSVDSEDLPDPVRQSGSRTYRSITVDGEEVEFSDGFAELHTRSYQEILNGRGFGLEENRVAIQTVSSIRNMTQAALGDERHHPFLDRINK